MEVKKSAFVWPAVARLRGRRLLRGCKNFVGLEPAFLPLLLRLTPLGISREITDHTDLVVEGFPRSGNTFTVFALGDASNHSLRIASHVHHPAQVKRSMALGVPTVLVVREPVSALASYMIFGQDDRPRSVLREYISYHREVVPYADQLVVCDFSQVSSDLSGVISRINERFGLDIPSFDQRPENTQKIFDEISRQHRLIHRKRDPSEVAPRPLEGRSELSEVMAQSLMHPRYKKLLEEATEFYEFFTERAFGRQ